MRWRYEAQPWDVVSIPNGIAAKKAIQQNYEWIALRQSSSFLTTILPVYRRQRCCRCSTTWQGFYRLSRRLQGCLRGFSCRRCRAVRAVVYNSPTIHTWWDCRCQRPAEVVTTPHHLADHDYPFQGLQTKLHGIRFGELTTITAVWHRKAPSVVQSQLTFLIKENGSVTWHLKNLTAILLSDSCHQQLESPSILESTANEIWHSILIRLLLTGIFICLTVLGVMIQITSTIASSTWQRVLRLVSCFLITSVSFCLV